MIGTVAEAAGHTVHRQAAAEAGLVAANVVGVDEADPTVETETTTGRVDHTVIEIPVRTRASARQRISAAVYSPLLLAKAWVSLPHRHHLLVQLL